MADRYRQAPSARVHTVFDITSPAAQAMGFYGLRWQRSGCWKEVTSQWSPEFAEVPEWAQRCKRCFRRPSESPMAQDNA